MMPVTFDSTGLRRALVPDAFDTAAAGYDRLVAANPGYHRHLHTTVRRMGLPDGGAGLRLLDAGCGTGASTAALLAAAPDADIVAVDASAQMLAEARKKTWPSNVRFVHSRIEDLSDVGVTGPFDAALAAYLIRNLSDPDAQLREFAALLRPGGTLAVHEYSVRDSPRARAVWRAVSWGVIIPAGGVITRDTTLYRHLYRSVMAMDGVGRLVQRLRDAGYSDVRHEDMPGWQRGILHSFVASAPGS